MADTTPSTNHRSIIAAAIARTADGDLEEVDYWFEHADAVIEALTAAGLLRASDDTVPKQTLRDLADEWVRPGRNVRIMEDGYPSVFMLGPQEYAAELRAAIGDETP